MELEDIKPLLPLEEAEVDMLWADWTVSGGSQGPDLDPFVNWLRDCKLIDESTWRGLLVGGELHLMSTDSMQAPEDETDSLTERFLLLGVLGKGAMGEVHLAQQRELKRKVAVKRLLAHHATDDHMLERFLREVQITAQLDHPHIIPIYGIEYDAADAPVAAMKLVQGRTLKDFLKRTLQLVEADQVDPDHALPRRLNLFLKLCDALDYAHERAIVHRDLKPDNVMIGDFGEVYVMDWGIARSVREPGSDPGLGDSLDSSEDAGHTSSFDTHDGAVIGTPRYMSPEQAHGEAGLDQRSDQYSLGLLLYELVCLQPASRCTTSAEALRAAQNGEIEPVEGKLPGQPVPRELKAIIAKATQLAAADRYPSVRELADDVRRYLDGDAVLAQPDAPMQALLRWISRNRATTLILLLSLVVTALLAVTWSLVRQQQVREQAAQRQEHLGHALGLVSERASAIDEEFLRLQGLLRELAGAAHQVVTSPAPLDSPPFFLDSSFDDPELAPPDFGPSGRYGKSISTEWPVIRLAPGVELEAVRPQVERMAQLRTDFQRVMLASHDEADIFLPPLDRRQRLAEAGVPIVWAFFAVEEGVHAAFPGKGGYGADYDPRQRPWYRLGAHQPGPRWGNPYVDAQGQGLLLPFTTGVYDDTGAFRGVAGMELTFRTIIDDLLELPTLPGVRETFLVTEAGRVAVRSGLGADWSALQGPDGALRLQTFDDSDVVDELTEGRSGYRIGAGGELLVWQRMQALGWFYVARADAAAVFED